MFFSKKLQKYKNIKHCFFSRKDGFSSGEFTSLNCGIGSTDKKENVLKNLSYVSEKIGCKQDTLITLNQKHTNDVICFASELNIKNELTGDAIVSKVKNIGIGILTADCASILLYDPKNNVIGCVHAGWKGALNGVIKNSIKKFNKFNSDNNDIIAVVGPCISKANYKVKIDFFKKFTNQNIKNDIFFEKINNQNYNFDLRGYINKELSNLNIKNIENIEKDTFSDHEFFYSYRRSRFNNEKDYGRCISVILMT
jgi:YfiH family protein|tara:strand:- start:17 stop:778 length:762 start_codon:yes stop_codon:yes gene_type:complete